MKPVNSRVEHFHGAQQFFVSCEVFFGRLFWDFLFAVTIIALNFEWNLPGIKAAEWYYLDYIKRDFFPFLPERRVDAQTRVHFHSRSIKNLKSSWKKRKGQKRNEKKFLWNSAPWLAWNMHFELDGWEKSFPRVFFLLSSSSSSRANCSSFFRMFWRLMVVLGWPEAERILVLNFSSSSSSSERKVWIEHSQACAVFGRSQFKESKWVIHNLKLFLWNRGEAKKT